MNTDANKRLLTLFSSHCEWRKVVPVMVQTWIDAGLVEEVPGTVDPDETRFGENVRLYRLTDAGHAFIG
jgi:hypothetical protein